MSEAVRKQSYIDGTAARQLRALPAKALPALEEPQLRPLSSSARRNRERAKHMNFGYVLFLTTALCLAGFILVKYITLQADITNAAENLAKLETVYQDLKVTNNERYEAIVDSVNLNEVKRVAMEELGMVFISEDQVIHYTNENSDYVRQYATIP